MNDRHKAEENYWVGVFRRKWSGASEIRSVHRFEAPDFRGQLMSNRQFGLEVATVTDEPDARERQPEQVFELAVLRVHLAPIVREGDLALPRLGHVSLSTDEGRTEMQTEQIVKTILEKLPGGWGVVLALLLTTGNVAWRWWRRRWHSIYLERGRLEVTWKPDV